MLEVNMMIHFGGKVLGRVLALAGLGVFLTAHAAGAQTNVIFTTNWVAAPPNLLVVNGVVYDSASSALWTNLAGRVLSVEDVVVIENNLIQNVTTNGAERVAIRNYTGSAAVGNRIAARAMRVGLWTTPSVKLELWDCGTNALVPVVATNAVGPLDRQAIKKDRLDGKD
jgi:hypothetical protein